MLYIKHIRVKYSIVLFIATSMCIEWGVFLFLYSRNRCNQIHGFYMRLVFYRREKLFAFSAAAVFSKRILFLGLIWRFFFSFLGNFMFCRIWHHIYCGRARTGKPEMWRLAYNICGLLFFDGLPLLSYTYLLCDAENFGVNLRFMPLLNLIITSW